MADEIDRGQATGEVRRAGNPQFPGTRGIAVDDLNIPSQRLSEWRDVRDAGPDLVEDAIQGAIDEGRAPTKTDILKHVRGTFGTGDELEPSQTKFSVENRGYPRFALENNV